MRVVIIGWIKEVVSFHSMHLHAGFSDISAAECWSVVVLSVPSTGD